MRHDRIVFRAGLTRVFLGGFGLVALPWIYPAAEALRGLLFGYIAFALVEQALIWRGVGGQTRSFLAGLVDLSLVTFLVHRFGSVATPIVALYFVSGVLNALVVGLRIGVSQAVIGSAAYGAVLLAERAGALPYAPDAADWFARPPGPREAFAAFVLVSLMLFVSTTVVGRLLRDLRAREEALAEANARLQDLSRKDPLTGLANRRHLLARLEEELARVRRGHVLCLVMVDLDRFKRVNDEKGHLEGDRLLAELGEAVAGVVREMDVASRYGGDEFVVLLPDTDEEGARGVAERLVARVREVGGRDGCAVTASVGIAAAKPDDAARTAIGRVDDATYKAKQAGGDRVAS